MNNKAFLMNLNLLGLLGTMILINLIYNLESIIIITLNFLNLKNHSLSLDLIMDLEAILFFLSISWISISVFTYSLSYMATEKFVNRFMGILFIFVLSMFTLVFSANFFMLMIGWDGLGVTSFLLVIYYQNKNSHNAGMLTILTNRLGDVLIMTSMIFFLGMDSNWIFSMSLKSIPSWVSILIVLAAFTKSAQIPFSSWLPAAMAAPTPVSSLVHSSTLVTAGIFMLLRLKDVPATCGFQINELLMLAGATTMVMAGLGGLMEDDFKKMVALSTLSQLGLMITAIAMMRYQLAFFHLLTHAYFKALLFMATGSMIHSSSDYQDLRKLSLPFSKSYWTSSIITVSNLSLMGIPFLSGFYSKDLILEMMMSSTMSMMVGALFILGTSLTVLYSLRFIVLSSGSKILSGPLLSHKDSDTLMFLSYDKLFFLAITGGSILNYVYMVFSPNVLITTEMKNSIIILILLSMLIYGARLLPFPKKYIKWSLGLMLGLSLIAPSFLKSLIMFNLNLLDKMSEKLLIKTILFENYSLIFAQHSPLALRDMKSFWLILSVTPLLLYHL